MRFPYEKLTPESGSIDGYLFENETAGIKRGIFLNINIDFAPIKWEDSDWQCGLLIDWIPLKGRSWKAIEAIDCSSKQVHSKWEVSFYHESHFDCHDVKLSMTHTSDSFFRVLLSGKFDYPGYFGGPPDPQMPFAADLEIPFNGITLSQDSFFPKPSSTEDAQLLLGDFIDPNAFEVPDFKDGKYLFRPRPFDIIKKLFRN